MTRYTIESSISSLSLALSCVMAGSGDIDCLRIFRALRSRTDTSASSSSHVFSEATSLNYGQFMSYGMALGLLFLGGGRYSLKRDPVSIACLLLSILPRYPNRSADQQYHLQALRHLYILAVEPRVLQTIDVDNQLAVNVDLELQLIGNDYHQSKSSNRMIIQAPGLLPELQSIEWIRIAKQQQRHYQQYHTFYPYTLRLQQQSPSSVASPSSMLFGNGASSHVQGNSMLLPTLYVKTNQSKILNQIEVEENEEDSQIALTYFTQFLLDNGSSTSVIVSWQEIESYVLKMSKSEESSQYSALENKVGLAAEQLLVQSLFEVPCVRSILLTSLSAIN
jgi:hypothetical protein